MFVGNYNLSSREAGIGGLKNMMRLFKKDFSSYILTPSGYICKYGLAWPGLSTAKRLHICMDSSIPIYQANHQQQYKCRRKPGSKAKVFY